MPEVVQVPKRRLATVLKDYLDHSNLDFEILTIDAESYDLEVLESNDFALYRPRIILIEVQRLDVKDIDGGPVAKFLSSKGYTLFSFINPNLMFVRNDSMVIS